MVSWCFLTGCIISRDVLHSMEHEYSPSVQTTDTGDTEQCGLILVQDGNYTVDSVITNTLVPHTNFISQNQYSPISHTPGPIPRGMGCYRVDCIRPLPGKTLEKRARLTSVYATKAMPLQGIALALCTLPSSFLKIRLPVRQMCWMNSLLQSESRTR